MPVASVLVVDDDAVVTETFARMLQLEGWDVRTASSGEDALDAVESRRVDAIILDLRMPFVDGLEFLRRLRHREDGQHAPVAIVTGDYILDDDVLQRAHDLGATISYKPLWLDELVELTRRLLAVP